MKFQRKGHSLKMVPLIGLKIFNTIITRKEHLVSSV